MGYSFSKTKPATANEYLTPGIYRLKVTEVAVGKFDKGTPYIGFKFENEDGVSFTEKFQFGSDKGTEVSVSRLQYLHEGFFGKICKKDFSSIEEIAEYFSKYLTTKPITKTIVVGGNENKNTVFACLPYAGFILADDADVELGAFEPGSKEYKKVVRKSNSSSEVADKPNGILNDDDDSPIGESKKEEKTSKSDKKTSSKKEEKAPEDDDLPW